jgi:REP element-mobilizing transposase RayT
MEMLPLRKSHMSTGKLYFWTATINKWQRLLEDGSAQQIILDSLSYLTEKGKVSVYAFVIMPNHIHLIWQIHENNGKEGSYASFLKFTAHAFKNLLRDKPEILSRYKVDASNKQYEFWQRDSLAIELYSLPVAVQKLDYIHNNPLAVHWQLCNYPSDYPWSSAVYYETGEDRFGWLKNLFDHFYEW